MRVRLRSDRAGNARGGRGGGGALVAAQAPGDEEREVEAMFALRQRFDLSADDAANAGGLAHSRRVVDDKFHSPL